MGIHVYDVDNLLNINSRTGSDGYQAKYYSNDRKIFIKTQAYMQGVLMKDWLVEIDASKMCEKLNINCVKQYHCKVRKGKDTLDAVESANFELDGLEFISFESFIGHFEHRATSDSYFIKMSSIEKLQYCAGVLSRYSNIDIRLTTKYMLDLAIIDIIVGNIDRHTKNFGIFWNTNTSKFQIAKIFDNGMGFFENDYYRDMYTSIQDRLRNTYVAPYGEDPFDMLCILKKYFDLNNIYNFSALNVNDYTFPNADSKIYFKEVLKQLRR